MRTRRWLCKSEFSDRQVWRGWYSINNQQSDQEVSTMSAVNVTNVTVLDNPSMFLNPFQFEISYECLAPLKDGKDDIDLSLITLILWIVWRFPFHVWLIVHELGTWLNFCWHLVLIASQNEGKKALMFKRVLNLAYLQCGWCQWCFADLEWKLIYVGSAEDEKYDQVLESVLVGPVNVGNYRFVFQVLVAWPLAWFVSGKILHYCAFKSLQFLLQTRRADIHIKI